MKKFIVKVSIMLVLAITCFLMYVFLVNYSVNKDNGPTTDQQIISSFLNARTSTATTYILGNSRIYRGINPDYLTNFKAYNFAHDNDSFNQMYYKLLYLEENGKKIDTLIIGVDYFQFSFMATTRNYIYDPLFGVNYMKDFDGSMLDKILLDIETFIRTKNSITAKNAIVNNLLCKKGSDEKRFQRDNGQYIAPSKAKPSDKVERKSDVLDVQKKYFDLIVKNCADNGITLYVIMPPVRDEELVAYKSDSLNSLDRMITETVNQAFPGHYYNFSNEPDFKAYTNYTDITHLNEEAANRFSILLNNTLENKWSVVK